MTDEKKSEADRKPSPLGEFKRGFKDGVSEEVRKAKKSRWGNLPFFVLGAGSGMTAMTKETETKTKKPIWYPMLAGALFGFTSVYIGKDLIGGGANGESLIDQVNVSQIAALSVAGILLVCLVIVAVGFGFPKAGAAMKLFEDMEEWQAERRKMWNSIVGGGAWAIMMIILAFAEELNLLGSVATLVAMGLAACVVAYTSWRILGEYDELGHGLNSETYTYAMYLTLLLGGTWSVAAQLGFLPELGPLDWITLMTLAIMFGAIWAVQRRGLLDN